MEPRGFGISVPLLFDEPFEFAEQRLAAMKAALADESESSAGIFQIRAVGFAEQCGHVVPILRALAVVAGEDLQSQQMTDSGYGDSEVRGELDLLRARGDLRLDAGRREQKINDNPFPATGRGVQSCRGQSGHRFMLHHRSNEVSDPTQ